MSEKRSIIRQRNWVYELLVIIESLAIVFLCCLLIKPLQNGIWVGAVCYLLISNGLRSVFLRYHIKGIRLVKKSQYAQALNEFEKSYQFFLNHPWIDKYRFITMFQSSGYSYTEMALYNKGVCHIRLHNLDESIASFEQLLKFSSFHKLASETLMKLKEAKPVAEGDVKPST